ncbi:MAG: hypothetical protein LBI63_02865 [Candidatus Ancillula sp.]|jgi:hypothetical protein|nr:hypothetical protein [Candidatus Ancillula sp.]
MNLKKLTRGILAIGVAFAIVVAPNTVKFANAANTPSVEVNDTLKPKSADPSESKHFWTEKDDHTGTKTKVQITVTNHSSSTVGFNIVEDIKGYLDAYWLWDGSSWAYSYDRPAIGTTQTLSQNETKTIIVTTNTDQGLIKGHVRGVYVSAGVASGTVDVNMKKVD